ncbi:hypothetical protein EF910_25845 [Streptomyces sp. WAC07149]|nr:hypothetical protein EF910_25845 [Streptomyces sp. WAC07149]
MPAALSWGSAADAARGEVLAGWDIERKYFIRAGARAGGGCEGGGCGGGPALGSGGYVRREGPADPSSPPHAS